MSTTQILEFRNGFVLHPQDHNTAAPANWPSHPLDDTLSLTYHPGTQVLQFSDEDRCLVVLGEGFDPERGIYETQACFQALFDLQTTPDQFLDALDRMAGRFALLSYLPDQGWQVYHDAMGSRSVFYDRNGPWVASHIELIARSRHYRFADFFLPFLTSRGYISRDVKYLPGLATPYDHIRQLTPNTRLTLPQMKVDRYWPRAPLTPHADADRATATLVQHMQGLAGFLQHNDLHIMLGLTGGSDSRSLLAALAELKPQLFTWNRSQTGTKTGSPDSRMAARLAETLDLPHEIWPISNGLSLDQTAKPLYRAFQHATAGYRGKGSPWLLEMLKHNPSYAQTRFVRGFGGEIMRGFYQGGSNCIRRVNGNQLANTYGVNAGSQITRQLFTEFISVTGFEPAVEQGLDPNDLFYWEHRMGTWGSIALTEADLCVRPLVGYNSRNLYSCFLTLDWPARSSRQAFLDSAAQLAPKLAGIELV